MIAFPWYVIDNTMNIVCSSTGVIWRDSFNEELIARAENSDKKIFLILWCYWYISNDWLSQYEKNIRRILSHKNIKLYICCNTEDERKRIISKFGISSVYCNHNAFVDSKLFGVLPNNFKKRDVIYNARFNPIKRHELTYDIDSISYVCWQIEDQMQYEKIKREKKNFDLLNTLDPKSPQGVVRFEEKELCQIINESRIGLSLSAIEGANFSSIEYLLCGLPVISTKSIGGRDIFFNRFNSIIIEPQKEALTNAVQSILKNYPNRKQIHSIRSLAISKQNFFIRRFKDILKDIATELSLDINIDRLFYMSFTNKMLRHEGK